jgi:hypothetical protein
MAVSCCVYFYPPFETFLIILLSKHKAAYYMYIFQCRPYWAHERGGGWEVGTEDNQ